MSEPAREQPWERIGFGRRLMIMGYEVMLLFGVLFGAGLPVVLLNDGPPSPGNPLYLGWLLFACFLYLGLSWVYGGQTLAMRAWRVRLVRDDGHGVGWREAALRFVGGLLSCLSGGLGFLWSVFDAERRGWPELLSGTCLVHRPKKR